MIINFIFENFLHNEIISISTFHSSVSKCSLKLQNVKHFHHPAEEIKFYSKISISSNDMRVENYCHEPTYRKKNSQNRNFNSLKRKRSKTNQAQSFISIYVNLNIKYDVVTNKKLNKFMYLQCG
jgi:hypothetical protein